MIDQVERQNQKLVLVVDDTPTNISMISGLLKDTYRTKVATSGERAIEIAAAADRPDLVLLDVMMPGMDGYEVCRRLKENPGTREIPVVFLTALTDALDEEKGFAVGGVDYIHKPFSAPIVLARVKTQLALQAALEAARRERATLQRVMESMSDGLIAASANGTVEYANPRAQELLRVGLEPHAGYTLLEAFERSAHEYADQDMARAGWKRLLSDPESRPTVEVALGGPPRLDVELRSFPLVGESTAKLGFLVHDVSADREVTRGKEEMMRLVSHELRAPLSNLLGFTELMLARQFTDEQRTQFLQTMLSEEERLSNLINDFLDLERMAAGGQGLELAPLDLCTVTRRAVEAAGPDDNHPLVVDAPDNPPQVLADPDRLLQVLLNLISNARKYSPDGGRVLVHLEVNDREVSTTVADQGLGLPPEAKTRLFEKFYRVHTQDHGEIKGTGLGLAICRQIVEAHGGRIWASSPGVGQGSTFGFSIPRIEVAAGGTND